MKKVLKWGGIIFLVLIVIGMMSGGGDKPSSSSSNTKQEQVKKYQVAEVISTDKVELTVVSVKERSQVGGQYFKENASEGGTLITVDWKYKNISDKPMSSYSKPSIKLVDSKGIEYDSDLGKSSIYATEQKIDSKVWSDLNPGITVKEAKVFEVSKEMYSVGGWKLEVKIDGKTYDVEL